MARIRSIKPSIWTSKDMRRLTAVGQLSFLVMITQADDEGRLHTDAHHLATTYLPPGTESLEVRRQLGVMERLGMVQRYVDEQKRDVVQISNWTTHQKIQHPTPSQVQKPPEKPVALRKAHERSGTLSGDGWKDGRIDKPSPTPSKATAARVRDVIQNGQHEDLGLQVATRLADLIELAQPSAHDLNIASYFIDDFAYLSVDEMVEDGKLHVEYCKANALPVPKTIHGFRPTLLQANSKRFESGAAKAWRPDPILGDLSKLSTPERDPDE